MKYTEFTDQMMIALYLQSARKGSEQFIFRSLADHYGIERLPGWLVDAQHELQNNGLIQGPNNSRTDEQAAARITGAGRRHVEELLEGSEDAQEWALAYRFIDQSEDDAHHEAEPAVRPDDATHEQMASEPTAAPDLATFDSRKWTGKKLVLTDEAVIRELREKALELREKVYSIRFESNSDSQDLKGLCDALVAICEMAEPELTIIDRILSHPKFQTAAVLIAAVAAVRGALGI